MQVHVQCYTASAGSSGALMTVNWRLKQSNNGTEKKRLTVRVWDLFAGSVSKWCTVLESLECQFAVEKSLIAFQFLSLPAVIKPTTGRKRLELFNMAPGEFTAEVSAVQLPCFYCFYCFCSGTFLLKKKRWLGKYFCRRFHPVNLGLLFMGVNTNWCG